MADGAPDPILQLILTRSDVLELVQVVNSTAFADELAQATAELLTLWPPNHTGPLPPQHELLLHGFLVRVQRALDLSTDPGAEAHLRYMMWPLHRVVEPGCGAPLMLELCRMPTHPAASPPGCRRAWCENLGGRGFFQVPLDLLEDDGDPETDLVYLVAASEELGLDALFPHPSAAPEVTLALLQLLRNLACRLRLQQAADAERASQLTADAEALMLRLRAEVQDERRFRQHIAQLQ